MGETVVRLYEEKDAAGVVRLFARNHYLFTEVVTPEEYEYISRLRGRCFAAVAEKDGEIVAHMAVFRTGCLRVARPHQVYADDMLIDQSLRTHLYSFAELQRLVMLRIGEALPDVTEIISEAYTDNLASIFLQRQSGSVLLRWAPDRYDLVEFSNFGPSVRRLLYIMNAEHRLDMKVQQTLVPVKKNEFNKEAERVDGRYVRAAYRIHDETLTVWLNVYSGSACRLTLEKRGFSAGFRDGGSSLLLACSGSEEAVARITFEDRNAAALSTADVRVPAGGEALVPVSRDAASLRLDLVDTIYTFRLYPGEDVSEDVYADRREGIALGDDVLLDMQTGALHVDAGTGAPGFHEIWPAFDAPRLRGVSKPNTWLSLSAEPNPDGAVVTEQKGSLRVTRTYARDAQALRIHTRLSGADEAPDPLFGFYLDDLSARVTLYSGEEMILSRGYDEAKDSALDTEELFYYDLSGRPYASRPVSRAVLSTCAGEYEITSDKPFTALFQFGFLTLNYGKACAAEGRDPNAAEIDFGTIAIRRLQ